MGKQPRGFGQPTKSKQTKSSQRSQGLQQHPAIDMECLAQKEARLRQVFDDPSQIPEVSSRSLSQYRCFLQAVLRPGTAVRIAEPLDWEEPFVYGRAQAAAHAEQRQRHASYLDHYHLVALLEEWDLNLGLRLALDRVSDQQRFIIPLSKCRVQLNETTAADPAASAEALQPQAQACHDYCHWWHNQRPLFAPQMRV
ncbi:MAG: hypothetical protein AAGB01_03695 [Cyanobacteria bacterium P01_F01_bin.42]